MKKAEETLTDQRNRHRRSETRHIWAAAVSAGLLAADGTYTAQHSINNVVSHIGEQSHLTSFDISSDIGFALFVAATAYSSLRAFSHSRSASTLDAAIYQKELQESLTPTPEMTQIDDVSRGLDLHIAQ